LGIGVRPAGAYTPTELAARHNVTRSVASKAIKTMLRAGGVERLVVLERGEDGKVRRLVVYRAVGDSTRGENERGST